MQIKHIYLSPSVAYCALAGVIQSKYPTSDQFEQSEHLPFKPVWRLQIVITVKFHQTVISGPLYKYNIVPDLNQWCFLQMIYAFVITWLVKQNGGPSHLMAIDMKKVINHMKENDIVTLCFDWNSLLSVMCYLQLQLTIQDWLICL